MTSNATTESLFSATALKAVAFVLRVFIGWHFLYEGVVKLVDPGWTSAPYLLSSQWMLSDLFHWIAGNPAILGVVDFLNVWGLILIGSALILGLLSRTACIFGSLLLLLYYVANPPFGSSLATNTGEGHYLFVNKNLIEMAALWLIAVFPSGSLWGLDRLISSWRAASQEPAPMQPASSKVEFPEDENQIQPLINGLFSRRELIKNLSVLPLFGGFVFSAARKHGWRSHEEMNLAGIDAVSGATVTVSSSTLADLRGPAPKGRLGDLEMSRVLCGGNLISGFAHARDLIYVSHLLKSYFHDEKVMETLWLCEQSGINTAVLRTDADTIRILSNYWKRGGKIQWLAQVYPKMDDVTGPIKMALDNGAKGAFVQGNIADSFLRAKRLDLLEEAIDFIQGQGVPGGTAAHNIEVIKAVEESSLEADFYMKTLHHSNYWSSRREGQDAEVIDNAEDNYWDLVPNLTIDYMKKVEKPWIAYKILAAGAIPPKEGFQYAFEHGADFACVGMFDFQVVDNVNTINEVLNGTLLRNRSWYA
jgi:uncharacterized membrane protein YphA (DoxX/SURF4 family)